MANTRNLVEDCGSTWGILSGQRLQKLRLRGLVGLILLLTVAGAGGLAWADGSEVWLLIDGGSRELRVMRGDEPVQTFKSISVGRAGIDFKRRRGDDITPKGAFTIRWITDDSRFHHFMGFDYPSEQDAVRGIQDGVIDTQTYREIVTALQQGELPPQQTNLGGHIGIHGIGKGDPVVHTKYNWTEGCVALTNEQVDQLAPWVREGTRVVIR